MVKRASIKLESTIVLSGQSSVFCNNVRLLHKRFPCVTQYRRLPFHLLQIMVISWIQETLRNLFVWKVYCMFFLTRRLGCTIEYWCSVCALYREHHVTVYAIQSVQQVNKTAQTYHLYVSLFLTFKKYIYQYHISHTRNGF